MRKLSVFNLVTLDGYIAGPGGDISWHNVDPEFAELAEKASGSGNVLLFGRVTYDLMASYWPTDDGIRDDPIVAKNMNEAEKVVFSRTLSRADWNNTTIVDGDLLAEVRQRKEAGRKDLTLLGSGSIVAQLAPAGLIDEYQILLNPLAIGRGSTMFDGLSEKLLLKLEGTRTFINGNVLLTYSSLR